MCFTPQISLLIAIIEFILAAIILFRFRKSFVTKFIVIFIFLLGAYQMTQFFLCTTGNADFWVRAGFISYTFLPAVGLHFVMKLMNPKKNLGWKISLIYLAPVVSSLIACLFREFVVGSNCYGFYITTDLLFLDPSAHKVMSFIYGMYYFGFIALSVLFGIKALMDEKDKLKKKIIWIGLISVWLALLPAYILIIILPELKVGFPSIYCEFALLMALAGYIVAHMDNQRIERGMRSKKKQEK